MRHLKRKVRLTATQGQRKAILMNLAKSIFMHKKISTTLGKAKAVQPLVEKIISYTKRGGLQAYRLVESELHNKVLTTRVVEEIAPHYKNVNGGYTRIIKDQNRVGDCAPMAIIELTGDYTLKHFGPAKRVKKEPTAETATDKTAAKEGAPAAEAPAPEKKPKKVVKKVVVDKKESKKESKKDSKKE